MPGRRGRRSSPVAIADRPPHDWGFRVTGGEARLGYEVSV
jgi:hypothetical protein